MNFSISLRDVPCLQIISARLKGKKAKVRCLQSRRLALFVYPTVKVFTRFSPTAKGVRTTPGIALVFDIELEHDLEISLFKNRCQLQTSALLKGEITKSDYRISLKISAGTINQIVTWWTR